MNSLIRKEVRSILPAWIMAMALATLPVWIVWPGPQGVMLEALGLLVFAPFALGVLAIVGASRAFGQELNWGTFPVLLVATRLEGPSLAGQDSCPGSGSRLRLYCFFDFQSSSGGLGSRGNETHGLAQRIRLTRERRVNSSSN